MSKPFDEASTDPPAVGHRRAPRGALGVLACVGLATLIAVASVGCSKRDPSWAKATAAATQHATTYPNFKAVIAAQVTAGDKAMAEAEGITDPVKKDEAVARVVQEYGRVIAKLDELQTKTQAVDSAIAELKKLPADDAGVLETLNRANTRRAEALSQLSKAMPTTEAEAMNALQPAIGSLQSINGKIARAAALAVASREKTQ